MLADSSLHVSFLNHGGFERILDELRTNVKRDELVCSVSQNERVHRSYLPMVHHRSSFLDRLQFNNSIVHENHSIAHTK
jgi:hypothetical protein